MAFKVKVEGFAEEATIPRRFTCDGGDLSPLVQWAGEPPNTRSFALIMDDPDAPGGTWTHWLVWDIPASVHSLPEGDARASALKLGTNDFGRLGYGGPCPPKGRGPHRYFFRLFALDTLALGVPERAKRSALEKALKAHTIAETAYMGRYERAR
jgi:Raf kinase inhibitor-like YbhB/YbcL family protein